MVLSAVWFLPSLGPGGSPDQQRGSVDPPGREAPGSGSGSAGSGSGGGASGARTSRTPAPAEPRVPKGYKLSRDPAGFEIAVPRAWDRRSTHGRGQVHYSGGRIEMVVVNGRDTAAKYGKDPMRYQSEYEPELADYRASDWASTTGLRRMGVGEAAMAEGTYLWRDGDGGEDGGRRIYVRNRAMLVRGRYHLLLVQGSEREKKDIDRYFEAVADTYRVTRK